ncbi:(d)CMP kinase [Enemella sp. A6]|uniref:(d)CMP kinase n=1 Tax=Enemella sp. A6 TaxID=3440152 RepID=UPI003EBDC522
MDGPSGSGKSSTSRGVATRFGFEYLDTGAMYRAMTWAVLEAGLIDAGPEEITRVVREADLVMTRDPNNPRVEINGHDVTEAIRDPRVSESVSVVATIPAVREILIARQQAEIAESPGGIVAEGRDITTVVAPDADVRVLLVADPEARVARRQAELDGVDQADVTDQVLRRDRDDSKVAEFQTAADGVHVIDSTFINLDQVIDLVSELVSAARDRKT